MVFDKALSSRLVANRLQWMVDVAAPFQVPVGEALDGITGKFVMSSAPDCYEHSVFAWTLLMHQVLFFFFLIFCFAFSIFDIN